MPGLGEKCGQLETEIEQLQADRDRLIEALRGILTQADYNCVGDLALGDARALLDKLEARDG